MAAAAENQRLDMSHRIRPAREAALVGGAVAAAGVIAVLLDAGLSLEGMVLETKAGLRRTAQALALHLDGAAHASLQKPEQEHGEVYAQEVAKLRAFQEATHGEIAYAYTMRLVDGRPHFVLDAAPIGDRDGDGVEDHSFLGDLYEDADPAAVAALVTGNCTLTASPHTDRWGTFLSAFAPIRTAAGELTGIVGVDLSLASLHASRNRLFLRSAIAGAGALVLAGLLAMAVHRSRASLRDLLLRREREQDLRARRRAAEQASTAKSQFLAHMSHEIRTPLGIVVGNAELLLDGTLDGERRDQHVEVIFRSSKHLLVLLNEVLDLAKIESGHLTVEQVPVRLPELLLEVRDMFLATAHEKHIRLTLVEDCELPVVVRGDPLRMRQVLVNLVANAVKFTVTGGVTITARVDTAAQLLQVEVADTGPGMSAERLARLFRPFEQGDAGIAREHGGSGLGLVISRHLCVRLGGALVAESLPGVGSRFVASFATGDLAGVDSVPIAALAPTRLASPDPEALRGRRVLLADDAVDNRRLFGTILRRAGAEVVEAVDGEQAVASVVDASAPFDLLILDVQMPRRDGLSAARVLRTRGVAAPILALTAQAMAEDEARCRAAGCSEFAKKPISRQQLVEVCARLIAAAPVSAAAPPAPSP